MCDTAGARRDNSLQGRGARRLLLEGFAAQELPAESDTAHDILVWGG